MGHSDIAPLRKKDPGEKFPWKRLYAHNIGNWFKANHNFIHVNTKLRKVLFFKNLKKLGYKYFSVNKRNINDTRVIKSFQQHYLPKNITGKIDEKTFKISHFLTH